MAKRNSGRTHSRHPHDAWVIPGFINAGTVRGICNSYPFRLAFIVAALAAAVVIIHYRLLVKGDFNLLKANRQHAGRYPYT